MKTILTCIASTMFLSSFAALAALPLSVAESFAVTLDPAVHGQYQVNPSLPADGKFPAGTVVTVTTQPDAGYTFDAGYYSTPGPWGAMYHEAMTPTFKVNVNQAMHIGASFIEKAAVAHVDVKQDIVYAKPGVKTLKYDVFTPKGAMTPLPIVAIIHGGGWVANDENIMRGLARELTRGGQFVVASIDYRWAGKADGDATSNTMANVIEDVYGAIAHIMEHAPEYGGDASRIVLTGDSAGGHLAAVGSLMVNRIGDGGFGKAPGVFEFKPSYLPKGKSSADVRREMLVAIKAAAPSYGVFGGPLLNHYADDPMANDSWAAAIAPIHQIPNASERAVPQYLTRGTKDPVIPDEMCRAFMVALVNAGQRVEYVQVGGASHAFFDWTPDAARQATFKQYGVYYAAQMKSFFASVVNP
jgi:acetyl esterase/lipase